MTIGTCGEQSDFGALGAADLLRIASGGFPRGFEESAAAWTREANQLGATLDRAPVLARGPAADLALASAAVKQEWGADAGVGSVDFDYLEGFLGGDVSIALEVVTLFRRQAASWAEGLTVDNPDWRAVVHTIKGAARGIGANALGEACDKAEFGVPEDLPAVRRALVTAVADISAYEAEKGLER